MNNMNKLSRQEVEQFQALLRKPSLSRKPSFVSRKLTGFVVSHGLKTLQKQLKYFPKI